MQNNEHAQIKLQNLISKLWLTEGVGPIFVKKILIGLFDFDFLNGQIRKNALLDSNDFCQINPLELGAGCAISVREVENCQKNLATQCALDQELEFLRRENALLITIIDKNYPPLLRQIYAPPPVLTVQGSLEEIDWQKSISIVGSRAIKNYAIKCIDLLLPPILSNGFTTISGGAIGVDSMIHEKTLNFGSKTVVVLGSGLSKPYPQTNEKLFGKVVQSGGAIISTFPAQSSAVKGNFPARNRVIAGLSPACLVIQAAEKSGALITADFALSEGREVMAIPAPIDDPSFQGNNNLLMAGASFVCKPENIFHALSIQNYEDTDDKQSPIVFSSNSSQEEELTGLLKHMADGPIGIEELCAQTGLSLAQVQEELFDLEMAGKIRQNMSGCWEKI